MSAIDLAEPSAVWLTFAGSTLTALGAITVAVINTRRKVGRTEAMTIEIRHMVNSRATAQDDRIAQLAAQLRAAGIVPDAAPPPPSTDIELAAGTVTVVGEATTVDGDVVAVTGEAVITPADTPSEDSSGQHP